MQVYKKEIGEREYFDHFRCDVCGREFPLRQPNHYRISMDTGISADFHSWDICSEACMKRWAQAFSTDEPFPPSQTAILIRGEWTVLK